MKYKHILCECGGIIGQWDKRRGFECEKCKTIFSLYSLKYHYLAINEKTGWVFPMVEGVKA